MHSLRANIDYGVSTSHTAYGTIGIKVWVYTGEESSDIEKKLKQQKKKKLIKRNKMLSPKRTKFRKAHKGRIHGNAKGGTILNFGAFGLKAMQPERITARQIEAARRAITRHIKRQGRVWIRFFLMFQFLKNLLKLEWAKEGTPEYWACRIKPGRILFELDGIDESLAKRALN